jgi:hypothetical protein
MKKLLVTLAAVLVSVASAFAQGSVTFNNRTGAGDAPIFTSDGVTGAGSLAGIVAELDLVNGTTYTPVGTTTFRGTSGALANFITGVDLQVANLPAGSPATFVVRAYTGTSYDAATARGQSNPVAISQLGGLPPGGGPPVPTPDLSGLQTFNVLPVPEPSTIALGVLGAAALLLRRRK